jgi:hypothetical protein
LFSDANIQTKIELPNNFSKKLHFFGFSLQIPRRAGAETPALAIGIADLLTIPCLYEHTQVEEKQHAVRGEQSGTIRNQVTPFRRVALLLDKVIEFLTQ